ncbi:hypothetical protein BGZ57DRAFT_777246, partial [Hyaloscypha finlandica]
IYLSFNNIRSKYLDLVLYKILRLVIKDNITIFLDYKLRKIRDNYNGLYYNRY